MHELTDTFNSREIALALWGLVFVVCIGRNAEVRSATARLVRATTQKLILLILVLMTAYVVGMVYMLAATRLWNLSLLKDTIFWFVGVGLVALVNVNNVERDDHFFRKTVIDNVKIVVLVEFLVNFYTFPLLLELALVPIVITMVAVKAFVDARKQNPEVSKAFGVLIGIYGVAVLTFSIYHATTGLSELARIDNVRSFLLPIALTILQLPFIYALALVLKYDTTFSRLRIADESVRRYAICKILMHFHIDLYGLSRWSRRNLSLKADSKDEVQTLIHS